MTLSNSTLPNAADPGSVLQSPLTGYEVIDVNTGPIWANTTTAAIADTALADQTVTAIGTNRGTAYKLIGQITNVTSAAASTGVSLPSAIKPGMRRTIFNNGANPITVYALVSDTIDGTAGSTGVTLNVGEAADFTCIATSTWLSSAYSGTSGGGGGVTDVTFDGATSGTTTLQASAVAAGTLTLPPVTGTVAATIANTLWEPDLHLCTAEVDVTSSTALVNVTGLSQTVAPGTYVFDIDLVGTSGASTGGGWKLAFNYTTATLTSITAVGIIFGATTVVANSTTTTTTTQTTIVGSTSASAAVTAGRIWGTMVVSVGGTVALQFAQNGSSSTASSIYVGSKMTFIRIA